MDTAGQGTETARDEVMGLFTDYAEGFDDFDCDAVAACFAFPATLWQGGRGNSFADEDELLENIEALLDVFEREEIVHTRFDILELTGGVESANAVLRWRHERADGDVALEFSCRYLLVRDGQDNALRITSTVTD